MHSSCLLNRWNDRLRHFGSNRFHAESPYIFVREYLEEFRKISFDRYDLVDQQYIMQIYEKKKVLTSFNFLFIVITEHVSLSGLTYRSFLQCVKMI